MRVMRRIAAALLVLALGAAAPAQESIVTGISTDNIALTANFDGSEIFVFGAIQREGPLPEQAAPLDIIITIKGPVRPLTVRRKERRFGIWVNTEAVDVREAPSFYAIAATGPIGELLSETERLRYGIGMDEAVRRVGSHPTITDTRPFGDAVVRIRKEEDKYQVLEGGVTVTADTLFQGRFRLPASLVEGDYAAEFFLVRERVVIFSGETNIVVQKTGIERWLYNLSINRPLAYGVLSVALALAAGWLAATAFSLARR